MKRCHVHLRVCIMKPLKAHCTLSEIEALRTTKTHVKLLPFHGCTVCTQELRFLLWRQISVSSNVLLQITLFKTACIVIMWGSLKTCFQIVIQLFWTWWSITVLLISVWCNFAHTVCGTRFFSYCGWSVNRMKIRSSEELSHLLYFWCLLRGRDLASFEPPSRKMEISPMSHGGEKKANVILSSTDQWTVWLKLKGHNANRHPELPNGDKEIQKRGETEN